MYAAGIVTIRTATTSTSGNRTMNIAEQPTENTGTEQPNIESLNDVRTAVQVVKNFLESEETQAQRATIAKSILQTSKEAVMNNFEAAINVLTQQEDDLEIVSNDLESRLSDKEEIIHDAIEESFEENATVLYTEDMVNKVLAKMMSKFISERYKSSINKEVKSAVLRIRKPSGKFITASSVQAGPLVSKIQNIKRLMGDRNKEMLILTKRNSS